jgi:predicted DNA-binding transcriptional regulator AlpA
VTALLTTKQAAAFLGIAPATLDNWRSLKKGPPFLRVGARVRYEAADLRAWIEAAGGRTLAEATASGRRVA